MPDIYDFLIAPFIDYAFMQRALLGSFLLAISSCPVGVFLMLRRMSLTGDAMAHAILPGAATGFLLFGLQIVPMTIGGLIAGIVVAVSAGAVSRFTVQKEDASMAAFYLISLALGVLIVSIRGSSVDLLHVLFGTILALNNDALLLIALIATLTLIGGFQALGTLLSVGLMMLPAAAARFWTTRVGSMCGLAVLFGIFSCVAGLLLSYHLSLPSGPAIILSAGTIYVASVVFGASGIVNARARRPRHRTA